MEGCTKRQPCRLTTNISQRCPGKPAKQLQAMLEAPERNLQARVASLAVQGNFTTQYETKTGVETEISTSS